MSSVTRDTRANNFPSNYFQLSITTHYYNDNYIVYIIIRMIQTVREKKEKVYFLIKSKKIIGIITNLIIKTNNYISVSQAIHNIP